MAEITFTLVRQRATPLIQATAALFIGWMGMFICYFTNAEPGTEYMAAFIAIIFFTIINTVVSIAYESYLRYTIPSYYILTATSAILLLCAKYLSGISIWSLAEYRMMLSSVAIFYFIASTLVRGVRFIYETAENDL
jgi:hypothetical protein